MVETIDFSVLVAKVELVAERSGELSILHFSPSLGHLLVHDLEQLVSYLPLHFLVVFSSMLQLLVLPIRKVFKFT